MTVELMTLFSLVELYGEEYLYGINAFAFSLSVGFNYLISRNWVFVPGKYSVEFEFIAFIATALVGLAINYMVLWMVWENTGLDYRIAKAGSQ